VDFSTAITALLVVMSAVAGVLIVLRGGSVILGAIKGRS